MHYFKNFTLILIFGFFSIACSSLDKKVSANNFEKMMSEEKNYILIDVRTPLEYSQGHLPEAINLDYRNKSFCKNISSLDKEKTYFLYCRSGKRSASATKEMLKAGFTKIVDLDGGILAWEKEGKVVIK